MGRAREYLWILGPVLSALLDVITENLQYEITERSALSSWPEGEVWREASVAVEADRLYNKYNI
ncbi:MAG TPA: hypothetical protein VJ781_09935 [Pyrinomonadaceae bacterium]|nr:hypothetical protein [Pyrinomonadaceae bacterium]